MLGQVVDGKYEILSLVGEGGMGAVYKARHRTTGREAAVKVISIEDVARNETLIARFEREAQAAAKIRSPHIVEILDAGHDSATGHPYMVMELLVGMNVHKLLRQLGPLPPELAVRIAVQTCFGLEKAHAAGVVHRDIKPANLFLAEGDGGDRIVKLLDFGVAKFKMDQASEASDGLTRTGSVLGSPMFMSPEQARGLKTVDHRADIWSLGIVLYQLLSGKAPHSGIEGVGDLIITICSEEPAPLRSRAPWISPRLEQVVHGALKLTAGARYQSAGEMREALLDCLEDRTAWHLHQRMLAPMTEEERVARPASVAMLDAGDAGDVATVALDPDKLGASPRGEPSSEATMALDEGALLPPASPFVKHAGGANVVSGGTTQPSAAAASKWGSGAKAAPPQPAFRVVEESAPSRWPLVLGLGLGLGLLIGVAAIVVLLKDRSAHRSHPLLAETASEAPVVGSAGPVTGATPAPSASTDPVALPSAAPRARPHRPGTASR
ncbi:MAG: protein kinase [Deltaproteobacteria bacterium]|nr:protein kinase [Deltaproteobacteria bacterium]